MFLILDEDRIQDIVRDEKTKKSYPVLGVIKKQDLVQGLLWRTRNRQVAMILKKKYR